MRLLAPILTLTTDEAWCHATFKSDFPDPARSKGDQAHLASVHLQDWPEVDSKWLQPEVEGDVAALLDVRRRVNEAIEPLRAAGKLGKSLDAAVTLVVSDAGLRRVLEKHRDFLPELFIVSHVDVAAGPSTAPDASPVSVTVRHAQELGYVRCPRCWRWVPALQSTAHGDVCARCADAL